MHLHVCVCVCACVYVCDYYRCGIRETFAYASSQASIYLGCQGVAGVCVCHDILIKSCVLFVMLAA